MNNKADQEYLRSNQNISTDAYKLSKYKKIIQELEIYQIELEIQNEELRRSQKELEESRRKYFEFYDTAPCGYLTLDHLGIIKEANLTASAILGIDKIKLLNRGFSIFFVQDYVDELYNFRTKCLKSLKRQSCELKLLKKSYTSWIQLDGIATGDTNETDASIKISITDITEYRKTHQSLDESEKRFIDLLQTSDDAILLIDNETFVDCNSSTVKMLKYSCKEELLMTHPSKLSPPVQPDGRDSFGKAEEMIKIALTNGYHRFEWMHRKADSEDFPVEVSLTPVTFKGKTVIHCLWKDLTETKKIKRELKEYRNHLEEIVVKRTKELKQSQTNLIREKAYSEGIISSMIDGLWVVDTQGKTIDINPAILKMLCYDRKEIIMTSPSFYTAKKDLQKTIGFIKQNLTGHDAKGEVNLVRKDGKEITVSINCSPMKNTEGKIIGSLAIIRDISERKKNEKLIVESNLKLQELVMYDSLTGAINKKPFVDILEQNILRAKRDKSRLAIIFIDLDNFKATNDKFGHNIGDKVLHKATTIIRSCLRESDLIGRLGGDEFVICLNNIKSKDNVAAIAKKLNHVFSEKIQLYDQSLELSLSIGIALFPEDGDDAEELLKYSDRAMYEIKNNNKNSFRFFNNIKH